jgi:Tol biopolymer transport system component
MGIYQRNLEDFKEIPVMLNSYSDGNCMNCHTFCRNNSNEMMFHMRGTNSGTIIYQNGGLLKVNTKTKNTISPGVYPAWHPSGDYIAFSVNNIVQSFHSLPGKKVEVYDTLSDIVVYNIKKNVVVGCDALAGHGYLETFPSWSPDGRYIYYCSAVKRPPDQFNMVRYDLLRIPFDPLSCSFGIPDTVWKVSEAGKSISFPRISPDGRYLMACISDYGNFTIWHSESDLYVLDLTNGKVFMPGINSARSESFHSWSSSGRWIVFSSRRRDGLFTRPFFSYFDQNGQAHKPFLLPQKEPDFYSDYLKSYNLPELVTEKISLNPRSLYKVVTSEPENVTFTASE